LMQKYGAPQPRTKYCMPLVSDVQGGLLSCR